MRLRAVLFDLDGTLLNRRDTFRCHIKLQVARLAELFAPAGAIDIDRMMAIDDNGNCPRAEFYRQIEVEFGLAPGTSSQLLADFEARFPETCVPGLERPARSWVAAAEAARVGIDKSHVRAVSALATASCGRANVLEHAPKLEGRLFECVGEIPRSVRGEEAYRS